MARFFAVAILWGTIAAILLSAQQEYAGPRPPKKNTPYLMHADSLVETEAGLARERTLKGGADYTIPGDRATARTPLASPTLVVESDGMDVDKLQLFRLEVKNGRRELAFRNNGKSGAVPLRTEITQVSGNLYQIRIVDSLPSGEYALSPDGSNDVFCFEVF